jgi:hypothetical protein
MAPQLPGFRSAERHLGRDSLMHPAIRVLAATFLSLATGSLLSFPASAQQLPAELQPPPNEHPVLHVHGNGDQIYICRPEGAQYAWVLKAPEAQLTDESGKPFGKHFAGPSWEANDGSRITGKAAASVPSPDSESIPWLLVSIVNRSGEGVLARVTSVQRVDTKGGKAPPSGCDAVHAGLEQREHYSADYIFFVPK